MSGNKEQDANMVRAILYAVCVSAWASTVAGAIQSCAAMVKMSCFDQLVAFLGTLNDFTCCKVALAVGTFLFLTSYFYDEWKAHRSSEKDCLVLLGWACFVVQCATLNCLPCALICGVLGLAAITLGLFLGIIYLTCTSTTDSVATINQPQHMVCLKVKYIVPLFFSTTAKKWWLICENIVWGVGLVFIWRNQVWLATGIMASVLVSSLIHKIHFRKQKGGEK